MGTRHDAFTSSGGAAIDEDWRKGGQFTRLSEGVTHWRREGRVDGVPIVLVHGATVPSWEFDLLVPVLLRAGFQTLRFDLFGHGASDRLAGNYSFDRFVGQVIEMIESSGFPRPAILLGHSFGAALVAAVAAARPEWTSRLVLVTPMFDFNSTSGWTTLFRVPLVGELAMRFIGMPALIRRRRRKYERIGQTHLTERFIEQVAHAGFDRGLLSMIRTAALGDQSASYAGLRKVAREMLVITGEDDAIIPAEHIARVRALLPTHTHFPVKAEHNLLLTHPEVVTAALVEWLGAGLSAPARV